MKAPPLTRPTESEWLRDYRKGALARFQSAPLPSLEDESWRKTDLAGFSPENFDITNSQSSLEISSETTMKVRSFAEAEHDAELSAILRKHLSDFAKENTNASFCNLNAAFHTNSAFLLTERPENNYARLTHRPKRGDTVQHQVLLHVLPGAHMTVVEEFAGERHDQFRLWNSCTRALVEPGATLESVAVCRYTDCEYNFHFFDAHQSRDSRVHVSVVHTGGHKGKSFYTGRLLEKGARFRIIGVGAGLSRQFHDMEMEAVHEADHTTSSLLYRTVLRDRAHRVFNGSLVVPFGRRGVESRQTNNNILLSRRARAESMPRLKVQSEHIQCEHGATVGEMDPDALFYLLSRGVPEHEARKLLIEGFVATLIEEIPTRKKHKEILENIMEIVEGDREA